MIKEFDPARPIGILGGGQLGRMLLQAGIDLNLTAHVLDPDPAAPCQNISRFQVGKLTDYQTVYEFGLPLDLITIEIENVNTQALKDLKALGKKIFPQPEIIELIQDKRSQKQFYQQHNIPTADFVLTESKADVARYPGMLPAVHKLGREGYDGRGVQILHTEHDLDKAFEAPGVLEKLIPFEKEIAVIACRNVHGEVRTFPAVEMMFHPEKNLVEYLFSPASIEPSVEMEAERIATSIIEKLGLVGILAVEMFVLEDGTVLVNEMAPRPHNSGHQTIEGNNTSQYHQHWRCILGLPLGDTSIKIPSAMVNLLGEDGYSGPAVYEGISLAMAIEGANIHLYGKATTKPFRKMGHVTIVDCDRLQLREKAKFVKNTLRVKA